MMRKIKNIAHLGLAIMANIVYGFPSRRITVVGVTGTDGKTTTASLVCHILRSAGRMTAMITTVGSDINGQTQRMGLHVTTPSSFAIQKFLARAAEAHCEFAVLETSSHGIDQNRVWGIDYRVAAITNLTHEHLDYHKTFQAYSETKLKLLRSAKTAIINLDDLNATGFLPHLNNKVVTYSRLGESADYTLAKFPFKTSLFGTFNESNILAAAAICGELGIPADQIRSGILSFHAPVGRQEIVHDGDFKVMVDFAHTPNAVENILKEAKSTNPARLIHMFGAPGRRDVDKRAMMGQASSKYADIIVLTADDPRDERVADVNAKIREGIGPTYQDGKNLFEFSDRMDAIQFVLSMAQKGDFILMTGKGHEPTLAVGDQEIPWDEANIVRKALLGK